MNRSHEQSLWYSSPNYEHPQDTRTICSVEHAVIYFFHNHRQCPFDLPAQLLLPSEDLVAAAVENHQWQHFVDSLEECALK